MICSPLEGGSTVSLITPPLGSGDIWAVVVLTAVNQTSIWETYKENDNAACDDTVMAWLHTLNREWLKSIANYLLRELAMTILDLMSMKTFVS